ncbi:MAG: hypothetical protein K2K72_00060, partial [Duncaniella sp.]|nr:hypothetical protein [Duncaniella sp.]
MKKSLLSSLIIALAFLLPVAVLAQYREAFPGAEGYGRYTKGGRGGKVYHVTTLDDNSQPGSFRYAIEQKGPRTIVFDVDGTIHLKSELNLRNDFVTIAGQTAPGDGVCIADYPFNIRANNVIIRFMRFRPGNKNVLENGADGWDGLGALDQRYIIVDHCSVSWSIDECLSFSGVHYTTVQWCLVSQSLVNSGHSKGAHGYGGNWGGAKSSYHHNLMAHHVSRVPRLGPRPTTQLEEHMDMRNNILYNYNGEGCYGGEGMNVNLVNNYYKPGPANNASATKKNRIAAIGVRTNEYCTNSPAYAPALHKIGTYYVDGNCNTNSGTVLQNNWANGMYNQITWSGWDDLAKTSEQQEAIKKQMKLDKPIEFEYTTTHESTTLNKVVPLYVGASLHRDKLDESIISDFNNNKAASGTGSGNRSGHINNQDDVKAALGFDYPELKAGTAKTDTDGDGIPDEWETANKLNPNDATDGAKDSGNGYTNLELYMNSLVQDIVDKGNAGGKLLHGTLTYADAAVTLPAYDPSAVYVYDMGQGSGDEPGEEEDPNVKFLEFNSGAGSNLDNDVVDLYGNESQTTPHTLTWANGFVLSCIKTDKDLAGGNTWNKMKPIKFSNGAANRMTLPDGFATKKIEFIGYCNNAGSTSWIADISVEKDGALESVYTHDGTTDYVPNVTKDDWAAMTEDELPVITCNLSKPVSGTIWFKNGGKQPAFFIRIHKADTSGLENVIADDPRAKDTRVFNLMGVEMRDTENLAPGIYIRGGKKFLV